MQPSGTPRAPRLRGVLAALLAALLTALLLTGAGGATNPTAASVLTGASVAHAQAGGGPDSSTEHHAVAGHGVTVAASPRHGNRLHTGASPATPGPAVGPTRLGTTADARPDGSMHLTRSHGSTDGRAPPA
jgi:hypothetical protein